MLSKAINLKLFTPLTLGSTPILNVSFPWKLPKRLLFFNLLPILETKHLLPIHQSGFRKSYSTEILLIRILSDIYATEASSTCKVGPMMPKCIMLTIGGSKQGNLGKTT